MNEVYAMRQLKYTLIIEEDDINVDFYDLYYSLDV